MMTSDTTWIAGEEYWIRYHKGTYEVRRETPDCYPDNETLFTGPYDKCYKYLKNLEIKAEEARIG